MEIAQFSSIQPNHSSDLMFEILQAEMKNLMTQVQEALQLLEQKVEKEEGASRAFSSTDGVDTLLQSNQETQGLQKKLIAVSTAFTEISDLANNFTNPHYTVYDLIRDVKSIKENLKETLDAITQSLKKREVTHSTLSFESLSV